MTTPLYKHVGSIEAVLNLAQGRLKFTPVAELNDPSEMLPSMNPAAFYQTLADIRRNGFSDEQFRWLKHQGATLAKLAPSMQAMPVPANRGEANSIIGSSFFDNIAEMRERYTVTVEKIRRGVGVLCLSSRFDSLPMWAHYAAMASKFVIRFENLQVAFSGDATGSLNSLKPVGYVAGYEGMTFDPTTQDRLFFSKLADWGYEEEWRVVCALEDCEHTSKNYLKQIDARHITEVICGWKISAEDFQRLISAKLTTGIVFANIRNEDGRVVLQKTPPSHLTI
ncbi:DUF2971 domain-containing protein [Mesorhizobium sp. M0579]|uniref:DUF2971 domain-containing protein n=1 Tax=Mesorhizobium sp. M0579 TaxID=2956962 RepID=UPI0033352B33